MAGLRKRIIAFIYRQAISTKGFHKVLTPLAALFFSGIVLTTIFLALVCDKLLYFPPWPLSPLNFILSLPILVAGVFLWLWSVKTFMATKGTPVPLNPPPRLVDTGPYAYVRNPMLSGVFLLLFGIGFLLQSLSLVFILTPLFILASALEFKSIEEPELELRLGEAYVSYKERVPMFFPFIKGRGFDPTGNIWEWLAFWKPSLARRMTIYFTIFGLLIGYITSLIITVEFSRDFIKFASEKIVQRLYALSPDTEGDGLIRLREDAGSVAHLIKSINSNTFAVSAFNIYFRNDTDQSWQKFFIDEQNIFRSTPVSDTELTANLNNCLSKKMHLSSPLFYGRQDVITFRTDITRRFDRHHYILSIDIKREGLALLIRNNVSNVLLLGLLLLVISNILGRLFSMRLARPIKSLSKVATAMAGGEFERQFITESKDEIGTLADALNKMAASVREALQEREDLLLGILAALIRTVDAKSKWTAGHSERVAKYAEAMGSRIGISSEQMRDLTISAILHDIGKIGVPEDILDKPGRLQDAEFTLVKSHSRAGADIIANIPSYDTILPGVLYHHERWDGGGYPEGLKGESIPLFARIITVADVYDAITDDRPYRKAWSKEQALLFMEEQKEKMFDPEIVDVFLKLLKKP